MQRFDPDLLFIAFAFSLGLTNKPCPFRTKVLLEEQGFAEPEKMKLLEFGELFGRFVEELLQTPEVRNLIQSRERQNAPHATASEKVSHSSKWDHQLRYWRSLDDLERCWRSQMELLGHPSIQRLFWNETLAGRTGVYPDRKETKLAVRVLAARRLL